MIKRHLLRICSGRVTAVLLISLLLGIMARITGAQEPVLPIAPPDAEAGLALYNERCVVCHGPLGAGDGEQALAAGLEPRNFTDPAFQRTADPQRMFDIITNGSMASGMPPFGPASSNPINEGDRWNLIAAVYSFGVSPATLEAGQALFADLGGDVANIPGQEYWFTHSNEMALADVGNWGIDASGLTDEQKQAVVDYGRTQSYMYANPLAAFEPIAAATITGLIVNGSTSQEVTDAVATLRAFNANFEPTLSLTTTVDIDGRYAFNLENVLPEWVFVVTTDYNGLTFNSSPSRINRAEPELNLPLIVYDTTADPGGISIGQIHMILTFVPGSVQVSELYIFNNDANAVFVGESGSPAGGVVDILLPAGAESIDFRRSFGSLESFSPAPEVIQTETGWADTVPLRPGAGSTSLLVSYQLPYEDGLRLAHPLAYPLSGATVILPDAGVRLSGDGWVNQGTQALSGGSFATYMNNSLAGAAALSLELDGRARQLLDAQGNAVVSRNTTQELMMGALGLGLALAAAVVMVRRWQTAPLPPPPDPQQLLQAIADLDDAYANGRLSENHYTEQRAHLKEQLLAIWPAQT